MPYMLKMRMRSDTEYHSPKNSIRKSVNSKSIGKTLTAQSWISNIIRYVMIS